jgi:hypothetical protein
MWICFDEKTKAVCLLLKCIGSPVSSSPSLIVTDPYETPPPVTPMNSAMGDQLDSVLKAFTTTFTTTVETMTSQFKEKNLRLKKLDVLDEYMTKVKKHDDLIQKLEARVQNLEEKLEEIEERAQGSCTICGSYGPIGHECEECAEGAGGIYVS